MIVTLPAAPPPAPFAPEATRRAAFALLVELQDGGASVPSSRAAVGLQFKLTPDQVRAVEREGLDGRWPPLPAGRG